MCRLEEERPRRDTCTLSSTNALSRTAEKSSEKIGESFAALQNKQKTALLLWVLCFVSEPGQVGSQGGIRDKESIDADQKTITARARRSSGRKFRRIPCRNWKKNAPRRDTCTLSSTNALSRTAEEPSEKIGESFAALQNNQSTALLLWVSCFVSEPGQVASQGGIRHKESIDADQKL